MTRARSQCFEWSFCLAGMTRAHMTVTIVAWAHLLASPSTSGLCVPWAYPKACCHRRCLGLIILCFTIVTYCLRAEPRHVTASTHDHCHTTSTDESTKDQVPPTISSVGHVHYCLGRFTCIPSWNSVIIRGFMSLGVFTNNLLKPLDFFL
jgi:hypothetical protein